MLVAASERLIARERIFHFRAVRIDVPRSRSTRRRNVVDVGLAYDVCGVPIRDLDGESPLPADDVGVVVAVVVVVAVAAVAGSGRATAGADWSVGTFEGGIRRQRRKNDKNEEREDLTYSLHV